MRNARFLALILALLVAFLIYFSTNEHAADQEGNSRVQHSERQQDLTANQTIQRSELSTATTQYEETSSVLSAGPVTNEGLFERSYDDFLTPDVGDDPAQHFLSTLDLANSGDPAAMYELSAIYGYCGSRPDDPEKALAATLGHNEQRYSDGEISEVRRNSLNARFSTCETIWKVMPPEQVDWFARAKDGRNVLALLDERRSTLGFKSMPPEDLNSLLKAAVLTRHPSALFWASQAYEGADPENQVHRTVWQYLACQYKSSCKPDVMERVISDTFYEYQSDEILSTAKRLKAQIDEGDLSGYDFAKGSFDDPRPDSLND